MREKVRSEETGKQLLSFLNLWKQELRERQKVGESLESTQLESVSNTIEKGLQSVTLVQEMILKKGLVNFNASARWGIPLSETKMFIQPNK